MTEYPCPGPISLDLRVAAGEVTVVAEPRDTAAVEITAQDSSDTSQRAVAQTRVAYGGGWLRVQAPEHGFAPFWRSGRVRVAIRVPEDCALHVKTASARVECTGRYASGNLGSASGHLSVEHATGDLRLSCVSGQVAVERADAQLNVHVTSGTVRVGYAAGDATASSVSGDVEIARAGASVTASATSGDVRIGAASAGTVKAMTVSGSVRLGVVPGTRVWLDLGSVSGRTSTDLDMDLDSQHGAPGGGAADLRVRVNTVSGNISVLRADSQPATQKTT